MTLGESYSAAEVRRMLEIVDRIHFNKGMLKYIDGVLGQDRRLPGLKDQYPEFAEDLAIAKDRRDFVYEGLEFACREFHEIPEKLTLTLEGLDVGKIELEYGIGIDS
tara:strand:- start:696 stop:1016 length:321 start_codon:yes stop_codon:yes gene_type:complete